MGAIFGHQFHQSHPTPNTKNILLMKINRLTKFSLAVGAAFTLLIAARPALAQSATFPGNGNSGFGGPLGSGTLSASVDGSGGVDFTITLSPQGANNYSWANLGNDIVIYLDNGSGSGGIGTDTSGLNDAGDGGRQAISGYNGGSGRSIVNFGGLMNPQYAMDFSNGYGDIFGLSNASGNNGLNFIDGAAPSGTGAHGLTYSVSGDVASLDVPMADFGVNAASNSNVLSFVAYEVSETGYGSNEATATLSASGGTQGYGVTQTLLTVNTLPVPEPSSIMMLLGSGLFGSFYLAGRKRK